MDYRTILVTGGLAFGVFLLMAFFMGLKRAFRRTTPLKAHACAVMDDYGKPQPCVCRIDESPADCQRQAD